MPWLWNSKPDSRVETPVPKLNYQKGSTWKAYDAEYLEHALKAASGRFDTSRLTDSAGNVDEAARNVYLEQAVKGYREEANEALHQEFQQWLMGQHPANHGHNTYVNEPGKTMRRYTYRNFGGNVGEQRDEWKHTPWNQSQLVHLPGVREYFQDRYKKSMSKEMQLNLLADHGPQDLASAWQYFIHWVKGKPYSETLPLTIPRPEGQDMQHRALVGDHIPEAMHQIDYRQYRDPKEPPHPVDIVHQSPLEEFHEETERLQREQRETGVDMTEEIQMHANTYQEAQLEELEERREQIAEEMVQREYEEEPEEEQEEEQVAQPEEADEEEEDGGPDLDAMSVNQLLNLMAREGRQFLESIGSTSEEAMAATNRVFDEINKFTSENEEIRVENNVLFNEIDNMERQIREGTSVMRYDPNVNQMQMQRPVQRFSVVNSLPDAVTAPRVDIVTRPRRRRA